jgi:hypothetical protein
MLSLASNYDLSIYVMSSNLHIWITTDILLMHTDQCVRHDDWD